MSLRFLATPRWLGLAALMLLLAVVMVGLGDWQLHRYHERSAVNARIDAGAVAAPSPLTSVVPREWTRVEVAGRYDAGHEILARGRTVNGAVGYEVLTPLVRDDGTAVLVDRGWLPAPPGGASVAPQVPPAPPGLVNVIGRVRLPESGATVPTTDAGRLEVRRIAPAKLVAAVPYPLVSAYLTLDSQSPPADPHFTAIQPDHLNAWQNAGYVVQWWAFAALTLVGYVLLARREVQLRADAEAGVPVEPVRL